MACLDVGAALSLVVAAAVPRAADAVMALLDRPSRDSSVCASSSTK